MPKKTAARAIQDTDGGPSPNRLPPANEPTVFDDMAAELELDALGSLNDRALIAKARWEGLRADAKAAKQEYDELAAEVVARLRLATHPEDRPLLEMAERASSDLARMQAADKKAARAAQAEAGEAIDPPVVAGPIQQGAGRPGAS